MTSVGAGALGTTALLILYPKLPVARIAGSDIAHAVPLTLIAGIGIAGATSPDAACGSIPISSSCSDARIGARRSSRRPSGRVSVLGGLAATRWGARGQARPPRAAGPGAPAASSGGEELLGTMLTAYLAPIAQTH